MYICMSIYLPFTLCVTAVLCGTHLAGKDAERQSSGNPAQA